MDGQRCPATPDQLLRLLVRVAERVGTRSIVREFGAFLMASQDYTTDARAALMRCLGDPNADVAAVAAQSLELHSDFSALDAVLSLLEGQTGDSVTPVAWAAASLAALSDEATRERVRGRCGAFENAALRTA